MTGHEWATKVVHSVDGPYREIWCGCGVPEDGRRYQVLVEEWDQTGPELLRTIHQWRYVEDAS